jgi:hypothetical protein
MVSKVFMICDAYESGYGHGLANDGLDLSKTPHGNPEHGEAYQLGYEKGQENFQAKAAALVQEPKLVLALPIYEKRSIVIAPDETIDGERVVCVAIKDAAPAPSVSDAIAARLQKIASLAQQGMCHGLLADDYCRQIAAIAGQSKEPKGAGE